MPDPQKVKKAYCISAYYMNFHKPFLDQRYHHVNSKFSGLIYSEKKHFCGVHLKNINFQNSQLPCIIKSYGMRFLAQGLHHFCSEFC